MTHSYPDKEIQQKYCNCFDLLQIEWIVTTNYDTLLESILVGKSYSIPPDESFVKISNMVPVYHIHGVRTDPDGIVITNEDYAKLFRPSDYRQARLPFLIKESLVLMVGYGLGDINVLTAVDWSNNVYTAKNKNTDYEFPIIQLLYKEDAKDYPYKDDSGIIILEIQDIESFFVQLQEHFNNTQAEHIELGEKIAKYIDVFNIAGEEEIERHIKNTENCRIEVLDFIASLPKEYFYIYNSYLNFIRLVINKINYESRGYHAFSYYDDKLCVLLDIMEHIPLKIMPETFVSFLALELNSLAPMIGRSMGEAWQAYDTWEERKNNIPKDTCKALLDIARHTKKENYKHLKKLLSSVSR